MDNENLKVTISKPIILAGVKQITYVNSKGEKVTFSTNLRDTEAAFNIIQEELKDKSVFKLSDIPNILQKVETIFPPKHYNFTCADMNTVMRHAIEDFSKDYSDGGNDITPKEISQWYERIHAANK